MAFKKSRSNRTLGSRGRGLIPVVVQCLTSGKGKNVPWGNFFLKFNVIDTYIKKKICIYFLRNVCKCVFFLIHFKLGCDEALLEYGMAKWP